jgi:hypothetical protein
MRSTYCLIQRLLLVSPTASRSSSIPPKHRSISLSSAQRLLQVSPAGARAPPELLLNPAQRLLKVCPDILHVLHTTAVAYQGVADANLLPPRRAQVVVGHNCGLADQRLHAAQAGAHVGQLHHVAELQKEGGEVARCGVQSKRRQRSLEEGGGSTISRECGEAGERDACVGERRTGAGGLDSKRGMALGHIVAGEQVPCGMYGGESH